MSLSSKVWLMFFVALADWTLMHFYSFYAANNILMRESMRHPCVAIWILRRIDYVSLGVIVASAIYIIRRRPEYTVLEYFERALLAFSILWPLLVLVAWQIQSMPIMGLQGFK